MRSLARAWATEPEALALAVGLTLSGASSLLADHPGSLSATLPWWLRAAWSVALLTGGGLRVAGLVGRRAALDAAGCWLLAPVAAVYGAALLLAVGGRALVPSLIVLAIGTACAMRVRIYARLHRSMPKGDR